MDKIVPFIKWPGGKRSLLKEIRKRIPNDFQRYLEPFVGAGSVLLDNLQRFDSEKIEFIVADLNKALITAWSDIQSRPGIVIRELEKITNDYQKLEGERCEEFYYGIRDMFNDCLNECLYDEKRFTAFFIFLNLTGYNGIYRTNSKGVYNVSFGKRYEFLPDVENIRTISKLIRNVNFIHCSFDETLKYLDENTFAYLDPPYKPVTKIGPSTGLYGSEFSDDDQLCVAEYLHYADSMGTKFLMSNSYSSFFIDLYNDIYDIDYVYCQRSVNSDPSGRGPVQEIMVRNFNV